MTQISHKSVMSPMGDITLFTLVNSRGCSVVLSTLGACIVEVNVPDSKGQLADVVIGYANPADYLADGPCAGKVPGRYANRIAKGHFSINGKEYTLAINNGPNALHGGPTGFQNRIWNAEVCGNSVVFSYFCADGEEGYPGNLHVKATYTWSDDNELSLVFDADTDQTTVINLTNHSYFNLAGHDSGSALDHNLWLACANYLPTDDTLIPTGEIAPVAGTPMDFTVEHKVGRDIKADFPALIYGKGYDNCWVVDGYVPGQIKTIARLSDEKSGRILEVATDQPAAQVYTGNWLKGAPKSKAGHDYEDYDAIAIECQDMPDAPNHPNFPSTLLNPGEKYNRSIIFKFKTK